MCSVAKLGFGITTFSASIPRVTGPRAHGECHNLIAACATSCCLDVSQSFSFFQNLAQHPCKAIPVSGHSCILWWWRNRPQSPQLPLDRTLSHAAPRGCTALHQRKREVQRTFCPAQMQRVRTCVLSVERAIDRHLHCCAFALFR